MEESMINVTVRPSEEDLRRFPNNRNHFQHYGLVFFELTADADTSELLKNSGSIEDGVAHVRAQVSNPSNLIGNAPIEVQGPITWWNWPKADVRAIWTVDGKILWVNTNHYPRTLTETEATQCQLAIKVLQQIATDYAAIPPHARPPQHEYHKNKFCGAIRMLRCIRVGDNEWEALHQCVIDNGAEFYVTDYEEYLAALEWIVSNIPRS